MLKRMSASRSLWILGGFAGIELLLLLSFVLVPRFSAFAHEDLLAHFAAYCVACLWFLAAWRTRRERFAVAACFLALAVATELLQPLTPYHVFDWRDVAANVLGVLAALRIATRRNRCFDSGIATESAHNGQWGRGKREISLTGGNAP